MYKFILIAAILALASAYTKSSGWDSSVSVPAETAPVFAGDVVDAYSSVVSPSFVTSYSNPLLSSQPLVSTYSAPHISSYSAPVVSPLTSTYSNVGVRSVHGPLVHTYSNVPVVAYHSAPVNSYASPVVLKNLY